jgi:hypothetical protein
MVATDGYFAATGVTIRRGRGFAADDRIDGPMVVVINEARAAGLRGPGSDRQTATVER